ncbi:hypothetical protein T439DRAFT_354355 [Meredithblackwellia eburnea MCA 4105]
MQAQQQQLPFIGGPADHFATGPPTLADILTRDRKSSIAYDYIRDSPIVSSLLVSTSSKSFTTILVPSNSAIMSLARKPHQGPPAPLDGQIATYNTDKEEEEAQRAYLEKWCLLHAVKGRVDLQDDGVHYNTMVGGRDVWFSHTMFDKAETLLMPGAIKITGQSEASNGMIIYIDGTLSLENAESA